MVLEHLQEVEIEHAGALAVPEGERRLLRCQDRAAVEPNGLQGQMRGV